MRFLQSWVRGFCEEFLTQEEKPSSTREDSVAVGREAVAVKKPEVHTSLTESKSGISLSS